MSRHRPDALRNLRRHDTPPREARFGTVPGVADGDTFDTRAELRAAGVHRPLIHGICGTGENGAESIVLSDGYVDDEDHGDRIIYTGAGGRDPETGRQIKDQTFTRQNRALQVSCETGAPVRVIRGTGARPHGPPHGYCYEGLWRVVRAWSELGRDGFQICRFELAPIGSASRDERRQGE